MGRHHMQVARDRNLTILRGWIKELEEPLNFDNKEVLVKRCCVVMGCTAKKAREYLDVVT